MAITTVRFYGVDPTLIFSTTIGGTSTYEGPGLAAGVATITDNEAGIQELTLDDDSSGGETASADVTVAGNTSTGTNVDAEAVWTIRDTVTGQQFEIAEFDVETGAAAGRYLLSEFPLVPGRSYETIAYDSNPNVNAGDPVFTYGDFQEFPSDGIVEGTAGNDTINTSYLGDPDGDQIDNSDNIVGFTPTEEVFRWIDNGTAGSDISGGISTTIGGIDVDVSYSDDGGGDSFEIDTANQYGGAGPYEDNSAATLVGLGPAGDTATVTVDFAASTGSTKEDYVKDINFRINEIDAFSGSWQDIVTITAIGPDGQPVDVTITPSGSDVVTGNTVTASEGNQNATDAESSVLITIAGPVSQLTIDYDNGDVATQFLTITDIHFTTIEDYGDQDDVVVAGAGDDIVDPSIGNDTVDGGTGNDTIFASLGNDSLLGGADEDVIRLTNGFGTDTVEGGEAGSDNDELDASTLNNSVNVVMSGNEAGTLTDGTSTALFTEIEDFRLSAQDDTFDGTAASSPTEVLAGGGDDTVTTGSGSDTLSGGLGADVLAGGTGDDSIRGGGDTDQIILEDGFGTDTILGGETGNDNDTLDGTAITSGVDVDLIGDEFGTFSDGADTADFFQIETFDLTDQADSFDGGASNASATVNAGAGSDTIIGTSAADLLDGGDDADLIGVEDSFGADTITGGEGGTDADTLSGAALTGAAAVVLGADEAGTLASGGDTADFSEIEEFVLTGQDDTFDGTASNASATVDGGAGSDTITGTSAADEIFGGDDADLINFADNFGDDTITGGEGGTDADTLSGDALSSAAAVVLTGDEAGIFDDGSNFAEFTEIEEFVLTDQDDFFDGTLSDASATVDGGAGSDTIAGTTAGDDLSGGDDADLFIMEDSFGADTIAGGEGGTDADTLSGAALTGAAAVVLGGDEAGTFNDGTDTATFTEIEEFVLTGQDDTFDGTASNASATVDGGAGSDTITGTNAADEISGGDDADLINLADGFGADTIAGGEGGTDADTLSGDALTGPATVVLGGDEAGTFNDGTDTATFTEIEEFVLTGQDDTFDGTASNSSATVDGGAGSDTITGTGAADDISGGDDADLINLADGFGADTIAGGEGGTDADTLSGDALTGPATVVLGGDEAGTFNDGTDTATFTEIEEFVLTDQGDTFDGTASNSSATVDGGAGSDTITGTGAADEISGGDDADLINLVDGFGADTIAGGEGGTDSDTLDASGLTAPVTVNLTGSETGTLGDGTDTASFSEIENFILTSQDDSFDGSAGSDPVDVMAGAGADTLTGGSGADTLDGGIGDDVISGGDGNDEISGGDGDDRITVGAGDTATGGDGDDLFIISSQTGTGPIDIVGGEGNETGGDTLDFGGLLEPGTLNITTPDSIAGGISGTAELSDGTIVTFTNIESIICFASGTLIQTERGDMPVQDLAPGDLVMTADHGLQPLRWVGAREVPATGRFAPIVISKGVLGNHTALKVSPQHRILITGSKAELLFGARECLVAAKHLLHWDGVYRDEGDMVSYHHILFDDHQIVYANGTASESFHPGREAISSLEDAAREEVLELFPELREEAASPKQLARRSLKAFEARAL